MGFVDAIRSGFANWNNFNGRSLRSEFWWWTLFLVLVGLITGLLDGLLFGTAETLQRPDGTYDIMGGKMYITYLVALLLLVPSLALSVRRLHDMDKSGWWYLINLIPFVGAIVFLIWMAMPGTPGPNRFDGAR